MLGPGARVAHYEIDAHLGVIAGARGPIDTYRARDDRLRRFVVFYVDEVGGESVLERARHLARFAEPVLAKVYDLGVDEGRGWAALEPIDAPTIEATTKDLAVSAETKVLLFVSIARVLASMHDAGLGHGALDGHAIVVHEGSILVPGLPRLLAVSAAADTMPPAADTVRSAPEDTMTADVDQRAWGVLGRALVGSKVLAGVNVEVDRVFERAAVTSGRGFASMHEAAEALATAASGVAPGGTTRWRVRPRVAIGVSVALIVAVMTAAVAISVAARRELAPERPPDSAKVDLVEVDDYATWKNPEALAGYHAGRQSFRDASLDSARASFTRAAAIDPTFAAADLWLAIVDIAEQGAQSDDLRLQIQSALARRDTLAPHDAAVLAAIEPLRFSPPSVKASADALAALAEKPGARLDDWLVLALVRILVFEFRSALMALDHVLAIEPNHPLALNLKARALVTLGDVTGAREVLTACLRASPSATSCLSDLNFLEAYDGHCVEAERVSRQMIALDPYASAGYRYLARALDGRDAPVESTLGALTQSWERTPAADRAGVELADRAKLAIAHGDFASAEDLGRKWAASVANDPDDWAHMRVWRHIALLQLETGDPNAAHDAEAYEKRRAGWQPDGLRTDNAILALQVEYRAGARTRAEVAAARDLWLDREANRERASGIVAPSARGERWVMAYAQMAVTPEDAHEALAVLDRYRPLPDALTRDVTYDAAIGHTYLLAGDVEGALPYLARGANSCTSIESPTWWGWAVFDYAAALQTKGDARGACLQYARILARWGGARPRSKTADQARRRIATLGCRD